VGLSRLFNAYVSLDGVYWQWVGLRGDAANRGRKGLEVPEKNTDRRRTIAPECIKGFRLESPEALIFYIELVAGGRFELTTFGL
jgi:hypothetical protein